MADVTVTIPSPVLQGNQQFQVSLSEDNGNSWTFYGWETNASFTITGLDPGHYEMRATLDGCEVIYCFDVTGANCACPTNITATLQNFLGVNEITVQMDLPSGMPTCGIDIEISGTNNNLSFLQTHNYANINQLTHVTGNTYKVTLTVPLANLYTVTVNVTGVKGCYNVRLLPNTNPVNNCPQDVLLYLALINDLYYIVVRVISPNGPYDHPITLNFTQNNVTGGLPDIGSKSFTLPNNATPFNYVTIGNLNPNPNHTGVISYNVTMSSPGCKPVSNGMTTCYYLVGCGLIP